MTQISNTYREGAEPGKASSMVVLLHGLGSNGRDLISLVPYWAPHLPNTAFLSPDAPFPCDMVPEGFSDSFQWFSLMNRESKAILEGVQMAAPILDAYLNECLEEYGLEASRLTLCGFSQGTMMSLYSGPRFKSPLAGILGYSGALVWPHDTDYGALQKCPVRLVHGQEDDVVPVDAYHMAKKTLSNSGFTVDGHVTPGLQHSIDEDGLASGLNFLQNCLSH